MDDDLKNSPDMHHLQELLSSEELHELLSALETVINFRNGFGMVEIAIEHRQIKQIAITSTLKPGKSG